MTTHREAIAISATTPDSEAENIVERLKRRIREAQASGYKVRSEWLEDPQPGWCEIAGMTIIFLDLSQPARDQLEQLEQSLAELSVQPTPRDPGMPHAA